MTQAPGRALRGQELSSLVTGEGVLIDVPPASLASRALSTIIDHVLYLAVTVVLVAAFGVALPDANDAVIGIIMISLLVFGLLVLPVVVEVATRGRSLGKLITKLRVVRDDGGPIVFRHAFVRALIGIVEFGVLQGSSAAIAGMFSKRVKRLGDMAAGTYAVREETALRLLPPPTMPPRLAGWAAHADLAQLPDGLALGMRQFVCRRTPLSAAASQQVGQSLIAQVLPLVSPPPPAGASIEEVLAAVLVERSRRDSLKIRRDFELRSRTVGPDPLATRY